MRPRSAMKLANALTVLDWSLGLSAITWLVSLFVDLLLPVPGERWKAPSIEPLKKGEASSDTSKLEDFKACWETRVLEPAPKIKPQPPPEKQPDPPAPKTLQLPFEWAGAIVDTQPKRSYAILLDKRTHCQVLVREGELIPETSYRVTRVETDKIHINCGSAKAFVEREKPWQKLGKAAPLCRISVKDSKITIVDNADLDRYGLQKSDRIIAVEGKKVESFRQLRDSITGLNKNLLRISVLREGKIVLLMIPAQATACLLASEQ